jgi:hypothetical protein
MVESWQLNMFGPPESADSYPNGKRADDMPVPCEREVLWPSRLVAGLHSDPVRAAALLDRLYGDVPKRTRLRVAEVCRRLRCDSNVVYRLIDQGELSAVDASAGIKGVNPHFLVYRTSLVLFLFRREFWAVSVPTRTDLDPEDLVRVERFVTQLRKETMERKLKGEG